MLDDSIIKRVAEILKIAPGKTGNINFAPLTGDASDRSYFRISSGDPKRETFVLMKMRKGFNSPAEEITKSSLAIDELPFLNIQKFLKTTGTPVPEIIGFDPGLGIIVLEDLGDTSLYSKFPGLSKAEIMKTYGVLIEEMVKFQSAKKPKMPCIAFHRKYDEEMCLWELDHFTEWGIEAFLEIKIGKSERKIVGQFYKTICKTFLGEKLGFCHRDYHSKNVMMQNDGLKIIDFQDALLAPPQYDLASLLKDSYVTIDQDIIDTLVDLYITRVATFSGTKIDRKQFLRAFDIISIHRNLKAAGRFVFIEKKKNNSSYIQHIPRTINYVRNNLKKYGEFEKAAGILLDYFDRIEKKIKGR